MSRRVASTLHPGLAGILILLALCLLTVVGYSYGTPLTLPPTTQTAQVPVPQSTPPLRTETPEVPASTPPPVPQRVKEVPTQDTPSVQGERAIVQAVMDGDTIEVLLDGRTERVRYIGIDTPETVHPSKPVQCFGTEASAKNKSLVLGKEVTLVPDMTNRDKYDRLLRYVYLDGVLVNEQLVREGYAYAYTYPPDTYFDTLFKAAEREAREAERGLWGAVCDTYVTTLVPVPAAAPNPACAIKGNVSAKGEKIYHVPGCKLYEKTVIKEEGGERWFCTETEAQGAGWRKAQNC
jgi:micrococcal nuclease